MNKILVATPNHYLFPLLQKLPFFVEYDAETDYKPFETIIDLSLTPKFEKFEFIQKYKNTIITDVSLLDHSELQVRGKLSTVFPSPNKKFEAAVSEVDQMLVTEMFKELELTPTFVHDPKISFVFPRILVQIINEAFFAMEDKVATPQDIDTAMLYGVNYPKGPVAWGQEAGFEHVVSLLEELYTSTNDKRYLVCRELKNHGLH